jgi:hypothetical protein
MLFPQGYLLGHPTNDAPVFDGRKSSFSLARLRNGLRKAGDRFRSQITDMQVLADGTFKGFPWQGRFAAVAGTPASGIPATLVEPTTNTGLAGGGEKVFQCTTPGTTDANRTEPNWASATVVNDTVAEASGTGVWTLVGFTPPVSVLQKTPKSRVHSRFTSAQTTSATASQIIASGGIVDGLDLAIPDNGITRITDLIQLHKPGTAHGGTIEIESDWVRTAGGAPAQIGASAISYNLIGATVDGTTVAHVANGNRIELQGSPESPELLNWRICRRQLEGVD